MPIMAWILFGLLVGVAGGFLTPGRGLGGFLVTAALGMAGAVGGGLLGRMIGFDGNGTSSEAVVAVIGSIVPLAVLLVWEGAAGRSS